MPDGSIACKMLHFTSIPITEYIQACLSAAKHACRHKIEFYFIIQIIPVSFTM